MKMIFMFSLGSRIVCLLCRCMLFIHFWTQQTLGNFCGKQWETGAPLTAVVPSSLLISLSPPLLFRVNIQLTVRKRRQRTLHYTALFANIFSVKTFCRLCLLLCQVHHCGCFHVNDLECYFFKECILKRNSYFCFCVLSQTLFSPIFSFPHRML